MKAICYVCHKEFERKPALIKRAKHPTCSKECRDKMYTKEKIKVKCCICGKEIETLESRGNSRKCRVCSNECKRKFLSKIKSKEKVELQCPICNKYFEVYPYRIKSQLTICCSRSCATKLQEKDKRNHPNYNENLTDEERIKRRKIKENVIWRNEIFKRDNFTCYKCHQYGGKLEAHHLNGYNWDKENRFNIDNGITLCYKCHKEFHKIYGNGNNTKEQFLEYVNQSGS